MHYLGFNEYLFRANAFQRRLIYQTARDKYPGLRLTCQKNKIKRILCEISSDLLSRALFSISNPFCINIETRGEINENR